MPEYVILRVFCNEMKFVQIESSCFGILACPMGPDLLTLAHAPRVW